MDKREIRAIVVAVAPPALGAIGILHPNLRVESLIVCQSLGDFFVALQAFECRRARPELVAGRALRSTAQRVMRLGERPGGNLGLCPDHGKQDPHTSRDQWAWPDKPAGIISRVSSESIQHFTPFLRQMCFQLRASLPPQPATTLVLPPSKA